MAALSQPRVSIILPTYNRGDVVMRAIRSVVAQTFGDWELIVIDDGSTDATKDLDLGFDSRIRLLRQANSGVATARNTGLRAARGEYIAFLDSDDEWLPHFLALTVGYLQHSSSDHLVSTEFYANDGDIVVMRSLIANAHRNIAQVIGSHRLDLPANESDEYLRVYSTRSPLAPWAPDSVPREAIAAAHLYQGEIFPQTRWGYMGWLPTTVITRHALETVGPFQSIKPDGATDYRFLCLLTKHFRSNFCSLPSARKHETGIADRPLQAGHLAAGQNTPNFFANRLRVFDELHWSQARNDPELNEIRKVYLYHFACVALRAGMRQRAIALLAQVACWHPVFWRAYLLRAVVFVAGAGKLSCSLQQMFLQI